MYKRIFFILIVFYVIFLKKIDMNIYNNNNNI